MEKYDEYADDVLNFKDSERDSVLSYMEDDEAIEEVPMFKQNKMLNDNFFKNMVDTPTRIINHSNEFLPKKKKIAPEKLAKRAKMLDLGPLKHFGDFERISDVDKSQKSTLRKAEEEKRERLMGIIGSNKDIENLQNNIKKQI